LAAATRNNQEDNSSIERGIKEYLGGLVSKALANSGGQRVHIAGAATRVVIAGGQASVQANVRANDFSGVMALVDDILLRRGELGLTPEQEAQLDNATATVKGELKKEEPKKSVVSRGLEMIQDIAVKNNQQRREKAISGNWPVLLEQLKHALSLIQS
jgi:hypothetical protein